MHGLRIRCICGLAAVLFLAFPGCDGCGALTSGGGQDLGNTTGDEDGSASTLDGSGPGGDSSTSDGAVVADGSSQDVDGGDPLHQQLPDFCAGSGAVVSFGSQDICAGDLAAQTFRFALCACQSISPQAQLTLDAFDSSIGPYGGSNVTDDGQLGLNQGDLSLNNKLSVHGSAFVGGGGVGFGPDSEITQNLYAYGDVAMSGQGSHATIGRNAYVNGGVGNRITIAGDLTLPVSATLQATVTGSTTRADVPQILPCPCATEQILDIAGLTSWAATHNDNEVYAIPDAGSGEDAGFRLDPSLYESGGPTTLRLPCGRFYLTRVNQSGLALDIYVQDRAVLFVDGDLSAQRFTIHVEPGGELDLFVAGDLTIGAAADFGAPDKPSSVRSYVAGNLSFQASSSFAGNVYAPNADIVFGAFSEVYGSLMVRNVTFNAAAAVHYDSSIRRASDSCVTPVSSDGGVVVVPDGGAGADRGAVDGASGVDAGPDGCSGLCSFECGELACLINSGQSVGTCGACRNDLDCCAPLLCNRSTGACYLPGG
ncbi:MAG: hypothetical protein ABIJ09_19500 [Pseudomonadota bacterium]